MYSLASTHIAPGVGGYGFAKKNKENALCSSSREKLVDSSFCREKAQVKTKPLVFICSEKKLFAAIHS